MNDDDLAAQVERAFEESVGFPPDEWPALVALHQQIGRAIVAGVAAQAQRSTGSPRAVRAAESQLAYEQAVAIQLLLDIAEQVRAADAEDELGDGR